MEIKIKKLFFLLSSCLLLILGLAVFPMEALADPEEDNVTWELGADGTLVISGSGVIKEKQFDSNKEITTLIINEGITGIEGGAFADCSNITSVSLPDTLQVLSGGAFLRCYGLTEITIPVNISEVPYYYHSGERRYGPFVDCKNLKTVTFAGARETLPAHLMRQSGITTIVWPEGLKEIPEGCFTRCNELTEINLPSSVTAIKGDAFAKCDKLSEIHLPDGLKEIEGAAFSNCTSIQHITLPDSLEILGGSTFRKCNGLEEVTIPESISEIPSFYYDGERRSGPFVDCSNLKTVIFAGTREVIPANLMRECGLTTIVWPQGLKELQAGCFTNCDELTEISLPSSVTTIKGDAFAKCDKLSEIHLPDGLKEIEGAAFSDCISIQHITLPNSLEILGASTFRKCYALEEITIPASVSQVPSFYYDGERRAGPFVDCSNLKTVTFAGSRETIPDNILRESGIVRINWPLNLKTIGSGSFKQCTQLESVTIPNSVTTIGTEAFTACTMLKNVQLPDSLTSLQDYTFDNCSSLEQIIIPLSVKSIGREVFKSCNSLKTVYMRDKITSINGNVFANDEYVTVFAPEFSSTTLQLIDKDINMSFSDTTHQTQADDVVDWNLTSFEMSDFSASGMIPVTLRYEIKDKYKSSVSNMSLTIGKSSSAGIGAVKKDGVEITYNVDRDGHVIVPLDSTKGTVSIYVSPNKKGKVVAYAKLNYKNDGTDKSELLGAVSEEAACLTLIANDTVSFKSGVDSIRVPVNGYAVRGKRVDIYVDDTLAGSATASAMGMYDTEVPLTGVKNYKNYTLKAVSNNQSGDEVTVEKTIRTLKEAPELTAASLYIEAHNYHGGSATFDLLDEKGKLKYITFQTGKKYTFNLKYKNAEQIERVFVISTKNGERSLLEAKWSTMAGAYVTDGFFNDDEQYIPGNLSVEIIRKSSGPEVTAEDGFILDDRTMANIPDKWKNATAVEVEDTASDYEALITLDDGDQVIYTYDSMSFTEFADYLDEAYIKGGGESTVSGNFLGTMNKSTSTSNNRPVTQRDISDLIDVLKETGDFGEDLAAVYSSLKNIGFVEYCTGEADFDKDLEDLHSFIFFDHSSHDIVAYIVDPSKCGNNIMKYTAMQPQNAMKKTISAVFGDSALGGFVYSMGGSIVSFEETAINLAMARLQIMSDPSLSEAERQAQLSQLDKMRDIACEKLAFQYISAVLKVMGADASVTGLGIAAIVLSKIIDNFIIPMVESGDFDRWLNGEISLWNRFIHWILDPSGFVYDGVTSNRLGGVKATLYYKETEESKMETLWDASEYDQENPLYTDAEGNYAWDVPEGYWRVKYEKEGYETAYSEWLPVPPPQTDVNISLIPNAMPEVTGVDIYETSAVVSFNQYIDPETVTGITITDGNGKDVAYDLVYEKSEMDASGRILAKSFTLYYDEEFTVGVTTLKLSVPDSVTAASGKAIEAFEKTDTVGTDVSLTISRNVHIAKGNTLAIEYSVVGIDQPELDVTIQNPDILSVESVGNGAITLRGIAYGSTTMKVVLKGTGLERIVNVEVSDYSEIDPIDPSEEKCEHSWITDEVITEASCEQDGEEIIICEKCGKKKKHVIEALGHTVVVDPEVPATTTSTGLTEGSHCSVCGKVLVEQEVIPMLQDEEKEGWWEDDDGNTFYYENGHFVTGVLRLGGLVYYFDKTGIMQTGVLKVSGKVYYLDPDFGYMHTGWLDLKGKTYYFAKSGAMVTGAQRIDGDMYYFNKSGQMQTGVLKLGGSIYYLDSKYGYMHTGWVTYKKHDYYFAENGKMQIGIVKIDGDTYYFNSKGQMVTGWVTKSGKYYYLQEDGVLAVSCTLFIDGKEYRFNSKGVCVNK